MDESTFTVATSFRGIWGTTPTAVGEIYRVLVPDGRVGLTVWGHIKASSGAWALAPFRMAAPPKVQNQAAMVALGRPGVGEELLSERGFVDIERFDVPFAWKFADPETYARTLASTGPAYEAMQNVGEDEFIRNAVELARSEMRDGHVLRAEIKVVGFVARKPGPEETQARRKGVAMNTIGFLELPSITPEAQALFDEDVAEDGYVMNVTKLWSHNAVLVTNLFDLMGQAVADQDLSFRQRGILVAACASTLGDSYCSLVWGSKLAGVSDPDLAASVIRGTDDGLGDDERALASWARKVARDPNHITAQDVENLRSVGFNDSQIFAITAFTALRLAFSTVNDALGVGPDAALQAAAPGPVVEAIGFGRPIEN